MYSEFIFISFIISAIIQIGLWSFILSKLGLHTQKQGISKDYSTTIIICAFNEEENLKKNLPHIINQNYRLLDVLVVNDSSTDQTEKILKTYIKKYNIFASVNIDNGEGGRGKKIALTEGIRAAKGEVLLLTDADCYPVSDKWVKKMVGQLNAETDICLGYSPYLKYDGFLNKFIRYETIFTAIQYLSFALIGKPYMGVGRNLCYKKHLFHDNEGFSSHLDILSGDDDLFINEIANKNNTNISIDKESFVYTEPKRDWKSFYIQKRRHLSTGIRYKLQHKLLLGLISGSHFVFFLLAIVLIALSYNSIIFWSLVGARSLVVYYFTAAAMKKLDEKDLIKYIPLLDFIFFIYYFIFALTLFNKNKKWK